MNKKYFIITLDTEADNQWNYDAPITTNNTKYLPRFQDLCEKFSFIPVWLTDYEMACDEEFVRYFKEKQDNGLCEIGMHLHAWSTPPEYKLEQKERERPFIYEYPENVIEEKVEAITELLMNKFGRVPVSHRAGRWAFDQKYAECLKKHGYLVDCSVTPGINWCHTKGHTGIPGPDFSIEPLNAYDYKNTGLLEIPVTINKFNYIDFKKIVFRKGLRHFLSSIKTETFHLIKGTKQWLRPGNNFDLDGLKRLVDKNYNDDTNYLMFMVHSSELMPGGSPNFTTAESIENLYELLEQLFTYISKLGYEGITLREYQKGFQSDLLSL